ncbi:MAG: iron ABC transporter permease [Clostridia bacterium]|nr:iron ABC transporter permease [Clostridia bacterium]
MLNTLETSKWRKFGNGLKRFFSQPANIILVLTVVVLGFFTLYPLILLVLDTFKVQIADKLLPGFADIKVGSYTGLHWTTILFSNESTMYFWKPLGNSLLMSLIASVLAILYGGIVAFLITRTDLKGKKFLSAVFVFPYIMPSWTIASFWQNFWQNPDIGTRTGGMWYNLGLAIAKNNPANVSSFFKVPESFVYGLVPSAIVLGLHYAPFAYILIGGILRNMDANLEEAATVLKAGRMKIIRRITLPIVMPALLSTFLLVFSSSMSAYAVPKFLGGPSGFSVLTTTMKEFFGRGWNGRGYIMAVFMIIIGMFILGLNQYFTGRRKSFTTVTGKSGQISYIKLKYWKWIIAVLLVILSLYCSILPLISFALESICEIPGDYRQFTLKYWISKEKTNTNGVRGIFFEPQVREAFLHSFGLAICCALIAGTVGILVGYAVSKKRGTRLSRIADNLAFLPYLMPSMAMGAAFLAIGMATGTYPSFFLLVLVGSIKYLPFASRSGINAMLQLSGEIEEAAIMVNVPWWKRMLRIIVPIQKSTFISGYLLPFTSCMRELSLFTLLAPTTMVLMTTLLDDWMQWWSQSANALNLIIIVTILVINFIVNKITGASIDKGVGG